jgi:hypothetical protein
MLSDILQSTRLTQPAQRTKCTQNGQVGNTRYPPIERQLQVWSQSAANTPQAGQGGTITNRTDIA